MLSDEEILEKLREDFDWLDSDEKAIIGTYLDRIHDNFWRHMVGTNEPCNINDMLHSWLELDQNSRWEIMHLVAEQRFDFWKHIISLTESVENMKEELRDWSREVDARDQSIEISESQLTETQMYLNRVNNELKELKSKVLRLDSEIISNKTHQSELERDLKETNKCLEEMRFADLELE